MHSFPRLDRFREVLNLTDLFPGTKKVSPVVREDVGRATSPGYEPLECGEEVVGGKG